MANGSISLASELWLPFLATAGAALTVLIIQGLNQYRKEHRQRLYAAGYMADVVSRLVQSELIIQKHTIGPHIEATRRILSGDEDLLEKVFDADDFDILSAGPLKFMELPDEHKLLIGYDNIQIVQAFDTLLYLKAEDTNRLALRSFVVDNLKSKKRYLAMSVEHQADVLNTYWDYLRSLEHEGKRLAAFTFHIFAPMLRAYIGTKKFSLFRTKSISDTLNRIEGLHREYQDFVPTSDFFENTRDAGIQGEL